MGDLHLSATTWPLRVAAVWLILLTGYRPGETRRFRWCEVRPDRHALIDAKTGPRYVLLAEAAQELLDELADRASGEWVFPGEIGDRPLTKGVALLVREFSLAPGAA